MSAVVSVDNDKQMQEPVQLDCEDRELYLLKVPQTLGAAWREIDESDTILGSIELEDPDGNGRQKGTLKVKTSSLKRNLPTDYKIDISTSDLKLKVFSQDGSGRMAIEGHLVSSGVVIPQRNSDYSKLCKERLIKSMVKERYVQALEELPRPQRGRIHFTIQKDAADDEDEDRASERLDKKVKIGKEELKDIIFHHFEDREYWPLKELNLHCRQPESYLKEILKELCVYHRKGAYKSCYELKPQFKKSST